MRPAHPCAVPHCSALVVGKPRCPRHTVDTKSPDTRTFYNSTRWKKVRAIIRRRDPICKQCNKRPSQTVDHLGELNDLRLEMLRGLCWQCHNSKSGKANKQTFTANPTL